MASAPKSVLDQVCRTMQQDESERWRAARRAIGTSRQGEGSFSCMGSFLLGINCVYSNHNAGNTTWNYLDVHYC